MITARVTDHAAQRYRERIDGRASIDEAKAKIAQALTQPVSIKPNTDPATVTVRTAAPLALRCVVETGLEPAVVTVMPGNKNRGHAPSDRRRRGLHRWERLVGQAKHVGMMPLLIRAHLIAGYASSDSWSPALDGILAYQMLVERIGIERMAVAQADTMAMAPVEGLPLAVESFGEHWWYAVSSPIRDGEALVFRRWYHRRFDAHAAEAYLDPRSAKVLTRAGPYKNSRLSRDVRLVRSVSWHCIGDRAEIERLLRPVSHIGAGLAVGLGHVSHWTVAVDDADPTMALLHRPIPLDYAHRMGADDGAVMDWGIRPPVRLPLNITACRMP